MTISQVVGPFGPLVPLKHYPKYDTEDNICLESLIMRAVIALLASIFIGISHCSRVENKNVTLIYRFLLDLIQHQGDLDCLFIIGSGLESPEEMDYIFQLDYLSFSYLNATSAVKMMDLFAMCPGAKVIVLPTVHENDLKYTLNFDYSENHLAILRELTWYSPLAKTSGILEALDLRLDLEQYFYYKNNGDDASVYVSEMYKIMSGPILRNEILTWNETHGLRVIGDDIDIWERRSNLRGITLKTAIAYNEPMAMYDEVNGKITNIRGVNPEIMDSLASLTNFTYTIESPKDGTYGVYREGVGWTGIVGYIAKRKADLSLNGLAINQDRSQVVDYTLPIMSVTTKLHIIKPSEAINYHTYTAVMTWQFWSATIVTLFATSLTFWIFKYFVTLHNQEEFGLLQAIAVTCTATIGHPFQLNDKRLSVRVLVLTTLLGTFVLYASYCASLISVLTTDIYQSEIQDIDDVVKKGYRLLLWKGTSFEQYFRLAPKGSAAAQIWETQIRDNLEDFPTSHVEAVNRMLFGGEKLVYFSTTWPVEYAVQELEKKNRTEYHCDIMVLPRTYERFYLGFALQKNSELKPLFDFYIHNMDQNGQIHKILSSVILKSTKEQQSCSQTLNVIRYQNTVTAFLLLAGGIATALILAAFENLGAKLKH